MSTTAQPGVAWPSQQARALADALADALEDLGLIAAVLPDHQIHPCIQISPRPAHGRTRAIDGDQVYVAPADTADGPETGEWWFWSSGMEPIARAAQVTVAADKIVDGLIAASAARRSRT